MKHFAMEIHIHLEFDDALTIVMKLSAEKGVVY
jgi:hypothetical protein